MTGTWLSCTLGGRTAELMVEIGQKGGGPS